MKAYSVSYKFKDEQEYNRYAESMFKHKTIKWLKKEQNPKALDYKVSTNGIEFYFISTEDATLFANQFSIPADEISTKNLK